MADGSLISRLLDEVDEETVLRQADAKSGQGSTSREFEAAGRDFVGDTAAGLAALSGSETLRKFSERQQFISELRRSKSDYTQSWEDVDGVGSLASYIGKMAINTAPSAAAMVAGGMGGVGIAARGLGVATRAGLVTARGAGALSATQLASTGQVAKAQIEETGESDALSALGLGTVNNLLNLAGVEGMAVRGLPKSMLTTRTGRAGVSALKTAAGESAAEVGQQFTEELGRLAVNQEYDVLNPDAMRRYKESAIGGALLGGVVGGAGGAYAARDESADTQGPPEAAGAWPPKLPTPPNPMSPGEYGSPAPDAPEGPGGNPPMPLAPREYTLTALAARRANVRQRMIEDEELKALIDQEPKEPKVPKVGDVRATVRDGLPAKLKDDEISRLTTVLSKAYANKDLGAVEQAMDDFANYVLNDDKAKPEARKAREAALNNAARLYRPFIQYRQDIDAWEALLGELGTPKSPTLPPINEQQSIQTAGTPIPPPADLRQPPPDNAQSAQEAGSEVTREEMFQFALQEPNPSKAFDEMLRIAYKGRDPDALIFTPEERQILLRKRMERVEAAKNADLKESIEKVLDDTEEVIEPDQTSDTTLGVPERKPAEKQPMQKTRSPQMNKAPGQKDLFDPAQNPVLEGNDAGVKIKNQAPLGKTKVAKFEREKAQREATFPTTPEPEAPAKANPDQGELFQANRKPTKAAQGLGAQSAAFLQKQLESMPTRQGKSFAAVVTDFMKANPSVKFEQVIPAARAATQSKFKLANDLLDQVRASVKDKAPKPSTEDVQFSKEYGNWKGTLGEAISDKVVDQVDELAAKKDYAKARDLMAKEVARVNPAPNEELNANERALKRKKATKQEPPAAAKKAVAASKEKTSVTKKAAEELARRNAEAPIAPEPKADLKPGEEKNPEDRYVNRMLAAGSNKTDAQLRAEYRDLKADFTRTFTPKKKPKPDDDLSSASMVRELDDIRGMLRDQPVTSQVQSWVRSITRGWTGLPEVLVYNFERPVSPREREATAMLKRLYGESYGQTIGLMTPTKNGRGTILVNSMRVETPAQAKALIFHEAIGHFGFRKAYGEQYVEMLQDIYASYPGAKQWVDRQIKADAEGVVARGVRDPVSYYTEEYIATLAESTPAEKPSILDRIRKFIRKWASKMGWPQTVYTYDDLLEIMRVARETVETGKSVDGELTPATRALSAANAAYATRRVTNTDELASASTGTAPPATLDDDRTRARRILERMDKRGVPRHISSAVITTDQLGRQMFQGMLMGDVLVDTVKNLLPSFSKYHKAQQETQAVANEYTQAIDRFLVRANALPNVEEFSRFMRDATMSNKWGYQPTWITETVIVKGQNVTRPRTVDIDPEQAKAYNELRAKSPEAADLADKIFELGFKSREDLRNAVKAMREQELQDDLGMARNATERRSIERQHARLTKMFDARVPQLSGPYVPLSRFGQYVTVGKSQEYQDLEAVKEPTEEQKDKLAEMRADPAHYEVQMWETMGKAELGRKEIEERPGNKLLTYAYPREDFYRITDEAPWMQMMRLRDMVKRELGDSDKFDRPTTRHIEALLKDLYYSTLAEDSARKHELKRERIAGVKESEILQGLATKGRADANFLAMIQKAPEKQKMLQQMREEANVRDAKTPDRKTAFNEVLARHAASLQFDPTPWQDKAVAISSMWHLLLMPRYYIQNALQTAMVTAPVLSARFGFKQSWSAIAGAYDAFAPVFKDLKSTKKFLNGDFDVAQLKISDEEKKLLQDQRKLGLIDIGLSYDMGYWEGGDNMVSKQLTKVTHWLRTKSQQVEVLNRASASLAAYRLAKEKGMSVEDATEYASKIIYQTHGDYSKSNAPRIFNQLPKVVTQFRKYQLIQLSLLGRHLYNSLYELDPAEKAIARKTLAYVFGQTAMVTGALGLPMVQGTAYLMSMVFGDEDEPKDGERFLRESLPPELATLLLKGFPAAAGIDVSANLGMGQVLSIMPYSDMDVTSREGLALTALAASGPIGGVAANMAEALGYAKLGDYQKAIEYASPSGVRSALRAYRNATEGMTNRQGDVLLTPDEMSFMDTFATSLGFTPTKIMTQRLNQSAAIEYDRYFKERVKQLKFAYTQAAKDGDTEAMDEVRARWTALQESKKRNGFKPTPITELLKAPAEQRKREKNTAGGVQFRSTNKKFVEELAGEE